MKISFVGAQGTGKSSTLEQVAKNLPYDFTVIQDQYRYIAHTLGYDRPRSIVREVGELYQRESMSALVSATLANFSQIDVIKTKYILADLDPISYYAFYEYWTRRSAREQGEQPVFLPFIRKLAQHYCDMFDINFYFPINIIPLKSDDMRAYDPEFQTEIYRINLKMQA